MCINFQRIDNSSAQPRIYAIKRSQESSCSQKTRGDVREGVANYGSETGENPLDNTPERVHDLGKCRAFRPHLEQRWAGEAGPAENARFGPPKYLTIFPNLTPLLESASKLKSASRISRFQQPEFATSLPGLT